MLSFSRVLACRQVARVATGVRGVASTNTQANSQSMVQDKVVISDSAVARLKEITGEKGWLRLAVEGGGCSGFQYNFDLEDGGELGEDDVLVERDGGRVVVDQTSLEYLQGATVDYHKELIRAAFRIVGNPQAEGGCSCGASFNIKLEL
eukprot:GFUD01018714.1.p1 GENE.GFUD01018714.1~~GFUD01018714.1.p1  ORF type:complete len:149 (+),score=54.34 GFUD01018714.1:171-617(+)